MRRVALLITVVAMLAFTCCLSVASQFEHARRETVLQWDDGVMDHPEDHHLGWWQDEMAVMFDLPEWATCVTGVQAYLRCEFDFPAGCDFGVGVLAPDVPGGDMPGANVGGFTGHVVHDTVWSWVAIPLSSPVGIGDSHFHGERRAFVSLEWGTDSQMSLGFDVTPPIDDATRYRNYSWGTPWHVIQDRDAMLRAVVSDEYVVPAEPGTWTRVKALFR